MLHNASTLFIQDFIWELTSNYIKNDGSCFLFHNLLPYFCPRHLTLIVFGQFLFLKYSVSIWHFFFSVHDHVWSWIRHTFVSTSWSIGFVLFIFPHYLTLRFTKHTGKVRCRFRAQISSSIFDLSSSCFFFSPRNVFEKFDTSRTITTSKSSPSILVRTSHIDLWFMITFIRFWSNDVKLSQNLLYRLFRHVLHLWWGILSNTIEDAQEHVKYFLQWVVNRDVFVGSHFFLFTWNFKWPTIKEILQRHHSCLFWRTHLDDAILQDDLQNYTIRSFTSKYQRELWIRIWMKKTCQNQDAWKREGFEFLKN